MTGGRKEFQKGNDSNCCTCYILLSVFVIVFHKYYVLIFKVEDDVSQITGYLLIAYAFVAPEKVQNMILGGILRSGGRTTYVMAVDLIGTWIFGVPLGLFSAFVLHLPIAAVYFALSMEEWCVWLYCTGNCK